MSATRFALGCTIDDVARTPAISPATKRQTPSLSHRQKILVAATTLCAERDTLTTEDLIVRCWTMFPEDFSLRGHTTHADSNKVLAKLAGTDGLCGLGWLDLIAARTYRITPTGKRLAAKFNASATRSTLPSRPPHHSLSSTTIACTPQPDGGGERRLQPPPLALSPATSSPSSRSLLEADVVAMVTLSRCELLRKFLRGSPLSFRDACSFWNVTGVAPQTAARRIEAAEQFHVRVAESVGAERAADPRIPPLSTCDGLLLLHRLMRQRFDRELGANTVTARGERGTPANEQNSGRTP